MSVAPSPSSSRGEIVLQPAYFTSSAFVHAARTDVDSLVKEFSQQYARSTSRPFTLFKVIWQRQGWTWIQFKVFDTRSRATFLRVVMRLFLERIGAGEAPLTRAAALFGLYTMFRAQPSTSAPSLYSAAQVEVTCDLYCQMMTLPDTLDGDFLRPIRPHVVHVQSALLHGQAFRILPRSELYPLCPRTLPREVVVEDAEGASSTGKDRKKRGRPSKRERIKKTRESLVALEERCGGGDVLPPSETRERYASDKAGLLRAISGDERWVMRLGDATAAVGERMETVMLFLS